MTSPKNKKLRGEFCRNLQNSHPVPAPNHRVLRVPSEFGKRDQRFTVDGKWRSHNRHTTAKHRASDTMAYLCGIQGCTFAWKHAGPHSSELVCSPRRSGAAVRVADRHPAPSDLPMHLPILDTPPLASLLLTCSVLLCAEAHSGGGDAVGVDAAGGARAHGSVLSTALPTPLPFPSQLSVPPRLLPAEAFVDEEYAATHGDRDAIPAPAVLVRDG